LLNRELVSTAKLFLVSVSPDIVKDCPKIRNLPKIFLRSFENVAPGHFKFNTHLSTIIMVFARNVQSGPHTSCITALLTRSALARVTYSDISEQLIVDNTNTRRLIDPLKIMNTNQL